MRKIIFCIDDEITLLRTLRDEIVSIFGHKYKVEISENPIEAFKLIEELKHSNREIPIVIADHIMPGMKGDILLEKIHKIYPSTVNIMLSGQVTIDGVINSINNAKLFKYLEKPWHKKSLEKTLLEAMDTYHKDLTIENFELKKKISLMKKTKFSKY